MVGLALLLVMSLVGGLTATILKGNEARRERELADKRFQNLRKLSDSFVTELHGAIQNLPGSLPARQLLLKRATEQLDALALESSDDRSLQSEVAVAYFNLASLPDMGLSEKDRILRKVVDIYEQLLKLDPENGQYRRSLAFAEIELGDTSKVRGSVREGLIFSEKAVAILQIVSDRDPSAPIGLKDLRDALSNEANYYFLEGKYAQSLLPPDKNLI